MNIVLMEQDTDCEVAAIATACQVSYDTAQTALGWRKLPLGLENPTFGNSLNLHKALLKLGFWKRNITLSDLLAGKAAPGRTVVLFKKTVLQQHWVVYAGRSGDLYAFWWGNDVTPKWLAADVVTKYFTNDGPVNEAFEVYKANWFRIILEKVKGWFK